MADNNDNIFSLVQGTKDNDSLPQFDYVVETTDGVIDEVRGFPVFSPQYVMIMRELPNGITIPVYMKPLNLVQTFSLDEDLDDDVEEDAPF